MILVSSKPKRTSLIIRNGHILNIQLALGAPDRENLHCLVYGTQLYELKQVLDYI